MWKTIEYTENRMSEIIDMTIEYYGKDNDISKRDFLMHEYFENVSGNAFIKLAFDDKNKILAGQYVVIPMKMKIKTKQYPVILSLNTLTRDAYRGKKIFTTLAEEVYGECKENGYKFCYGAPNPNSHPGFLRKLKFHDIGVMPLYLKIVHPSLLVREKFNLKLLEQLCRPLNLIFRDRRKQNTKDVIEISSENVSVMDKFWDKVKDKYDVIGVRNADFLRWRYINMPYREYKIFAVKKSQDILGYLVTRITDVAGMRCGMIVDFLIDAHNVDVGIELLNYAVDYFYSNNVGLMGCLMQQNFEEADCLKKMGFFKCPKFIEPQPFPIIYRKFNDFDGEELFSDFTHWFFTMGDYDVI